MACARACWSIQTASEPLEPDAFDHGGREQQDRGGRDRHEGRDPGRRESAETRTHGVDQPDGADPHEVDAREVHPADEPPEEQVRAPGEQTQRRSQGRPPEEEQQRHEPQAHDHAGWLAPAGLHERDDEPDREERPSAPGGAPHRTAAPLTIQPSTFRAPNES